MPVAPGLAGEVEVVVRPPDTADALGNARVHALATPRPVALVEQAAIGAVEPPRPAGAGTVGTRLAVRHLAGTPDGMRARARAILREVDGRRLLFDGIRDPGERLDRPGVRARARGRRRTGGQGPPPPRPAPGAARGGGMAGPPG